VKRSNENGSISLAAKIPAVKRRLSPGKKKPKNNPDSANIIERTPVVPIACIKLSRSMCILFN
jgi:hypothetical protein